MQNLEEETQIVASVRAGTTFQVAVAQWSAIRNFMNIFEVRKTSSVK